MFLYFSNFQKLAMLQRRFSSHNVPALTNFIDGSRVPSLTQRTLENVNPATGEVISTLPRSGPDDIDKAVAAAVAAQATWGGTSLAERGALLNKVADAMSEPALFEAFVKAESLDTGKPLQLARNVDVPRAIANLRFFASFAQHQASAYHPSDGGGFLGAVNLTERRPVGVVGLVTPWNLPLYLLTWKVAPALMMGNAVVAKPSEVTPTTASMLAHVFHECSQIAPQTRGLAPRGLLNVVHGFGPETGAALVNHPSVKAVSFTGGTATGKVVGQAAAGRFIKASLELGGKNATVVFADKLLTSSLDGSLKVDAGKLRRVAAAVCRSAFLNSGQVCLCGSRIFVEESVRGPFTDALVAATQALQVGDPADPRTDLGPLSSHAHRDKVQAYIDLAVAEGGTLLCGGGPPTQSDDESNKGTPSARLLAKGAYLLPTLVGGLNPLTSAAATEEVFGPLASVHGFASEAEVLRYANDATPYGLSSSVWTDDLEKAHRVGRALDCGMVWVNTWLHRDLRTPFGGTKASGLGREGGTHSLDFYSEAKNLCIALGHEEATGMAAPPMPGAMPPPPPLM